MQSMRWQRPLIRQHSPTLVVAKTPACLLQRPTKHIANPQHQPRRPLQSLPLAVSMARLKSTTRTARVKSSITTVKARAVTKDSDLSYATADEGLEKTIELQKDRAVEPPSGASRTPPPDTTGEVPQGSRTPMEKRRRSSDFTAGRGFGAEKRQKRVSVPESLELQKPSGRKVSSRDIYQFPEDSASETEVEMAEPKKRGRGRPKKVSGVPTKQPTGGSRTKGPKRGGAAGSLAPVPDMETQAIENAYAHTGETQDLIEVRPRREDEESQEDAGERQTPVRRRTRRKEPRGKDPDAESESMEEQTLGHLLATGASGEPPKPTSRRIANARGPEPKPGPRLKGRGPKPKKKAGQQSDDAEEMVHEQVNNKEVPETSIPEENGEGIREDDSGDQDYLPPEKELAKMAPHTREEEERAAREFQQHHEREGSQMSINGDDFPLAEIGNLLKQELESSMELHNTLGDIITTHADLAWLVGNAESEDGYHNKIIDLCYSLRTTDHRSEETQKKLRALEECLTELRKLQGADKTTSRKIRQIEMRHQHRAAIHDRMVQNIVTLFKRTNFIGRKGRNYLNAARRNEAAEQAAQHRANITRKNLGKLRALQQQEKEAARQQKAAIAQIRSSQLYSRRSLIPSSSRPSLASQILPAEQDRSSAPANRLELDDTQDSDEYESEEFDDPVVVIGDDAPTERVSIEAFGTRVSQPAVGHRSGSILEDRPWTDGEQLALLEGLMAIKDGPRRWELIRSSRISVLRNRSVGDLKEKAREIKQDLIENPDGEPLGEMWEGV